MLTSQPAGGSGPLAPIIGEERRRVGSDLVRIERRAGSGEGEGEEPGRGGIGRERAGAVDGADTVEGGRGQGEGLLVAVSAGGWREAGECE